MNRPQFAILAFLLWTVPLAMGNQAQEAPSYTANTPACPIGVVKIAVEQTQIPEGADGVLEYTFYASGNTRTVYNPFFRPLLDSPGKVVVTSANGVVLGDAIQFCQGSRSLASWVDWVELPYGSHIGARITFRLRDCFDTKGLPPGRYSIQLALFNAFVSQRPRPCGLPSDPQPFDRTTLCNSNVVEIEVVRSTLGRAQQARATERAQRRLTDTFIAVARAR